MKKLQLCLSLLIFVSLGGYFACAEENISQPNIIFILCDDLGYGDLGITGHPYVKSPYIDSLAKEGLQFKDAYMAAAWCAPSRAAIMTGIYPARSFNVTKVLDFERPTLTGVLKDAGYATAHFGKWHMGPKKDGPALGLYGIDEALIYNGSGPTWSEEFRKSEHYREKTTGALVDKAIDFIDRNKENPFFVNLWVYPTHSYIDPTPEQLAVYKDLKVDINDFENPLQRDFLRFVSEHGDVQDAMRAYCADVTALDTEVGRLLKALVDFEIDENTMIIFSSDNGPGPVCRDWDSIIERYKERPLLLNNVGSSGPYRARKVSLFDGGIHAPLFVRWPARIKASQVNTKTLFGGVDLLPTLASLVGLSLPEDIDGKDLSQAFLNQSPKRDQPLFWNDRPGWSVLRDKQWKAHLRQGKFSLYDMSKDLSESHDVTKSYPEIAKEYKKMLNSWEASIDLKNDRKK